MYKIPISRQPHLSSKKIPIEIAFRDLEELFKFVDKIREEHKDDIVANKPFPI